uniref:hypothetical protein n=1 Tax=Ruegeria lacuscaerulensis TaxID=55218 RepID=UPI001F2DB398
MPGAKDDPADEIRKGDIRCGGNRPTVADRLKGRRPPQGRDPQIDRDWSQHSADLLTRATTAFRLCLLLLWHQARLLW